MTSSVGVQYPQNPYFQVVPNYNYDPSSDYTNSRGGNYYSHPTDEGTYPSSSESSGYGDTAPSGYGESHYPSDHPTAPGGTGYAAPAVHASPPTKSFFSNFKKGGNQAMSALTLLAFFSFINLLHSCLKEHIDTMNPTVMVMTNKFEKTDNNDKFIEINSREQTSSVASTPSTNEEIIESENIEIPSSSSSSSASSTPGPTIATTLNVVKHKKPNFDNNGIVNDNPNTNSNPISSQDQPDSYDSNNYPNRTENVSPPYKYPDRYRPQHNYYDDPYDYGSSYDRDGYPSWSHHSINSHRRHKYRDPYSSYWDEYDPTQFPNHDAYDGASFLRIY